MIPTYGGLPLLHADESLCSGAAFGTDQPPRESAQLSLGPWVVEVKKRLAIVVARGGSDANPDQAVSSAFLQAQRGLDLLSIQGTASLAVRRFDEDHLVWWPGATGLAVRVVAVDPLPMDVSARATVIPSDGSVAPDAPPTPLSWHESYRYFRLSQTSDDLFDAFRNAYLALESLLSSVAPQKIRAPGQAGEREGEWFKRALTDANSIVALAQFAPPGTADPLQHLYQLLYIDMRSAMSHAKSGRKIHLPHDEKERADVAASLGTLIGLYLALAAALLGTRRAAGGMTPAGFEVMARRVLDTVKVYASDDETPLNTTDTVLNPAGGTLVELHTEPAETGTPFLVTKLAYAPAAELAALPSLRRVVSASSEGLPLQAAVLEAPLNLGSASRFEAVLGIRGLNVRQPRTRYLL